MCARDVQKKYIVKKQILEEGKSTYELNKKDEYGHSDLRLKPTEKNVRLLGKRRRYSAPLSLTRMIPDELETILQSYIDGQYGPTSLSLISVQGLLIPLTLPVRKGI